MPGTDAGDQWTASGLSAINISFLLGRGGRALCIGRGRMHGTEANATATASRSRKQLCNYFALKGLRVRGRSKGRVRVRLI